VEKIPYPAGARAPFSRTILAGVQQAILVSMSAIVLRQIFHLGGLSLERSSTLIQGGFLVLAIALLLQIWGRFGIGSGLLVPSAFGVLFLRASMAALQDGGVALLVGMMGFMAVVQLMAAQWQERLKRFFPPLLEALILLIIGLDAGLVGIEGLFALSGPVMPGEVSIWSYAAPGLVTLVVTIAMSVWAKGLWRASAALVGIVAGTVMAQWTDPRAFQSLVMALEGVALAPLQWTWEGASWRLDLLPTFAIAGLAANLETQASQKKAFALSHPDELSAPSHAKRASLRAGGMANFVAALFGTSGVVGSPSRVALSATMGIATRGVGMVAALVLVALAFVPAAARLFLAIPGTVVGAIFLYLGANIIAQGIRGLLLIRLDLRRSLVLGMSLIATLCVLLFPARAAELPIWIKPFFRTMLCAGVSSAILLNLVFRIRGTRQLTLLIDLANWEMVTAQIIARLREWGTDEDLVLRAGKDLQAMHRPLETAHAESIALDLFTDDTTLHLIFHFSGTPTSISGTWMADHIGLEQTGSRWRVVMDYED
jgi:xanthine permease XanP